MEHGESILMRVPKSPYAIAVDGPSGSGKSSLAKNLAAKLDGFIYLDTGALYRAIGLYVCDRNIDGADVSGIVSCLDGIAIDVVYEKQSNTQKIFLNGSDVSQRIRENHISKYASDVSKIPQVREFLLNLQREKAEISSIIMDGRDIGTVILPDAALKIFLTASPEERAKRRYEELEQKNVGVNISREQILREILERDEQDSKRDIAPLKPADDAILLDNSAFNSPENTLDAVLKIVKERLPDVCIR